MGPLSQFFISTLIDNFCSDIYDKIKNNFLESSLFQDFSTSIKTDFSIDECNKLLKSVFKKIRRNPYFTNLSKNELQQLMNDNKELIYSWIICDTPFKTELLKLQDDNSNSIHTGFLKSLYHFINIEKDNYSAISSQRIIQTNNKIYSNTETIITKIENINRRLSSTFSPELSEIEELLSVRKIHDAQQKLDALEQKILKNNVNEEIEKFYQLKANSYLLNSETQMEAIPWLNKLVMYSKSSFLKEYRKGLISFISKNYDEAFRILSLLSNMDLTTEENKLYSNFKFNLLFTTHKWEKVDLLIKDTSQDSSIWSIKADFFKENYDQAFSKLNTIDEVNVDFDDKVLFINIKIYYYIDLISKENYSFKIIEKLNEFIPEIDKLLKLANDDTSTKKTLYLLKALVFQYSNQTELSINEYINIVQLGDSTDPNYLRNYALVLFSAHKDDESLQYLKKYRALYSNDIAVDDLYFTALINIDPEQAENELQNSSISDLSIQLKIVDALLGQEKIESAKKKLEEFKTKYPNNPLILLQEARFYFYTSKIDYAYAAFKNCIIFKNDSRIYLESFQRLLQIGLSRRNLDYINETLPFLDDCFIPQILLISGYELGYAYILVGRLAEAHALIKKCRDYGIWNENIIRLDMSCYFHSQNYTNCIESYKQLKKIVKATPQDIRMYLYSLSYLGKRDELHEAIEILPAPENPKEVSYQTKLLLDIGEYSKALLIAENGYLKNKNNLSMMENFINVVLAHGTNQITESVIETYNNCWNEYSKIPKQDRNVKEYNCKSIEELLEIINENDKNNKKLDYNEFLNRNFLHISILNTHFNYFFLWKNIKELKNFKIIISDCSVKKLQEDYKKVHKGKLVIDLPSLITCSYLDILPLISNYFEKIYISQTSIAILENAKNSKNNSFAESCTSGLYQLNGYSYADVQIDYSDLVVFLNRIDNFRNLQNVQIVGDQLTPTRELIPEIGELNNQVRFLEYKDLVYAYTSDTQLLLENFQLRTIVNSFDKNFECYEIESILAHFLNEKIISSDLYFQKLYNLLVAKYFCIYFDSNFLYYYLEKNDFNLLSNEIIFLTELLSSNKYISSWCTNLLVQVSAICFNSVLEESKIFNCLDWIFTILNNRNDIQKSSILIFFQSLYQIVPLEQHKQLIINFWEEKQSLLEKEL